MKLQYCSDLHLEFRENKEWLTKYPLQIKGDILLLAGDIIPFPLMDNHKDFWSFVSDHFQFTYWVPGNHEYYYADAAQRSGILNEQIRDNVLLVNNVTVEHSDIQLIFSTLWSKINPAHGYQIERSMSDFQVVKYNGYRFSVEKYNLLHKACLDFITPAVIENRGYKKVVVTHHVPTFRHYPEQYKGQLLNEAFATELSDFIDQSGIVLWLFGHHHSNVPDFKIGSTTMATNQLGYIKYGENTGFNTGKIFNIE